MTTRFSLGHTIRDLLEGIQNKPVIPSPNDRPKSNDGPVNIGLDKDLETDDESDEDEDQLKRRKAAKKIDALEEVEPVEEDDDALFELYILDENDELVEAVGNLKNIPDKIRKVAASELHGGENSEIRSHGVATNKSSFNNYLKSAMDTGRMVTVHHNGKIVAGIYPANNYGRKEYRAIDPNPENTSRSGRHSKGGIVDKIHTAFDREDKLADLPKDFFKHNHVEIKSISPDKQRAATRTTRVNDAPKMQYNLQNHQIRDRTDNNVASKTPAGKFDDIRQAAVRKLTDRHLPNTETTKSIALGLHKKLGDAIERGDEEQAREHLRVLNAHAHRHNSMTDEGDNKDKSDYRTNLTRLRDSYPQRYPGYNSHIRSYLKNIRDRHNIGESEILEAGKRNWRADDDEDYDYSDKPKSKKQYDRDRKAARREKSKRMEFDENTSGVLVDHPEFGSGITLDIKENVAEVMFEHGVEFINTDSLTVNEQN